MVTSFKKKFRNISNDAYYLRSRVTFKTMFLINEYIMLYREVFLCSRLVCYNIYGKKSLGVRVNPKFTQRKVMYALYVHIIFYLWEHMVL